MDRFFYLLYGLDDLPSTPHFLPSQLGSGLVNGYFLLHFFDFGQVEQDVRR